MKDFTLNYYRLYLNAIKSSYSHILCFDNFLSLTQKPESFAMIRHDVDRCPEKAFRMALIEKEMGIRSTYYFRAKPHTFKPDIIKQISLMGHEIGYHYESLSDTNGNMKLALIDFENNLKKFQKIVPIKTISMHGRPFKPYDNRDIWRDPTNHSLLINQFGILGEIYIDIDYEKIAYVNDTGRNWTSTESNNRDRVNSKIKADFSNGKELYNSLCNSVFSQLVFQIHPERWSYNQVDYYLQLYKDLFINYIKLFFRNKSKR